MEEEHRDWPTRNLRTSTLDITEEVHNHYGLGPANHLSICLTTSTWEIDFNCSVTCFNIKLMLKYFAWLGANRTVYWGLVRWQCPLMQCFEFCIAENVLSGQKSIEELLIRKGLYIRREAFALQMSFRISNNLKPTPRWREISVVQSIYHDILRSTRFTLRKKKRFFERENYCTYQVSAIIQHNVLVANVVELGKQTGDSCNSFCCAVSRQETSRILDLVQSAANSNQATDDTSWTATQGFPCISVSNFKCGTRSYAKASLAWVSCHSLLCTCSAALKADACCFPL